MFKCQFDGAVLDITALPTEPHQERSFHMDLVAPDDLGTPVMSVEPGSDMPLDVTVVSLPDGVLFQAQTRVHLQGQCVRCLDPITLTAPIQIDQMFFTPQAIKAMHDEHGEEGTEDLAVLDGNEIELETLLRDNIVTKFPYRPLCSDDCPGLCDVCGEKWADLPPDHKHQTIDPRFAKLAGLFSEDHDQEETS